MAAKTELIPVDPPEQMVEIVGLKGLVYKCDVPLGKEFVEGERIYQASKMPSFYSKVPVGHRFRYGDKWYFRDAGRGVFVLVPNMPFGRPQFLRGAREFEGNERVDILEINDRGLA